VRLSLGLDQFFGPLSRLRPNSYLTDKSRQKVRTSALENFILIETLQHSYDLFL